MPFAELLAVFAQNDGHMHPNRGFPAQSFEEPHVLGDAPNPLLSPEDVGDPHEMIVDHRRAVVSGHPVGLDQHGIVYGV
ncbi:MAG: hypothetical protein UZ18_ATM001001743 [Armatimonadetes bacterium OLB18]|nr:MAG: hypothetical protein UZ18_ATM001001743 [Armatimonadetes bacterium OLB18]